MTSGKLNKKIFFLSNGPFGAGVILNLSKNNFPLNLVLTTPDRKAGRGQKVRELPVKLVLNRTNYEHVEVEDKTILRKLLTEQKPDLVIVSDFGWIIPPEIFYLPKFGFVVTHQSLLPKYRGTTPIQTAILNGDEVTGVSLIEMDEEVDHGPLIAQASGEIKGTDTSIDLMNRLAVKAANLIIKTIPKYLNYEIKNLSQDHTKATFTKKLAKTDGLIDWTKKPEEINRQVRAMQPWPKAFTEFKDKKLFIHAGKIEGDRYIPTQVQLEGKKIISWPEFLNGQRFSTDQVLEFIKK